MNESPTYYRATVTDSAVRRASVRGDVHASVCVIGAGFAGLNVALGLQQRGVLDVVILEKNEIGSGASGRNSPVGLKSRAVMCLRIRRPCALSALDHLGWLRLQKVA